jgi:hypothetical protein
MISKIGAIAGVIGLVSSLTLAFGGASREAQALATAVSMFVTITQVATTVLTAFNIPLTWTVALATMGVGVIVAMAAALAVLAAQASSATAAMRDYNTEAGRMREIREIYYHHRPQEYERRSLER